MTRTHSVLQMPRLIEWFRDPCGCLEVLPRNQRFSTNDSFEGMIGSTKGPVTSEREGCMLNLEIVSTVHFSLWQMP